MQAYIYRLLLFLPLQFSTLSSLLSASHVKRTLRRWLGKLDLVYQEARQHGRICKPCLTLFFLNNTDSRLAVLHLLQDVRCCSYPYRCQAVIFFILYSNTTTSFASPLYTKLLSCHQASSPIILTLLTGGKPNLSPFWSTNIPLLCHMYALI